MILSSQIIRSTVFKNFTALSVVQIANYIIPLILIPYITRILGVEKFGIASYAQNIITYLTLFVSFGFDYTATRHISLNRNDSNTISSTFWSVVIYRIILFIISLLLLYLFSFYDSKTASDLKLFYCASLFNLGIALFPVWFFQGIEKMGWIALTNCFIKIIGAICIFLFVRKQEDYCLYVFLFSFSYVIGGVLSFLHILHHYHILPFKRSFLKGNIALIKESFPVFINQTFNSVYSLFGITFIGWYYTDYEVGIYSGAFRIIMAVILVVTASLTMALFPAISKRFQENFASGWSFFCRSLRYCTILTIVISSLLFVCSPLAINILLGEKFSSSVEIVRYMSLMPFLVTLSNLLTIQGIYGLGLQRFAPFIGLISVIVSLTLNFYTVPLWGAKGAVLAWGTACIVEGLLSLTFLLYFKKTNRMSDHSPQHHNQ